MKSFKMRDLHVSAGKTIPKATDDVASFPIKGGGLFKCCIFMTGRIFSADE